jgi:SAM-dependent methyltransferase
MSPGSCRGCGRDGLSVVLDLGQMPLANRFLSEADLHLPEPRYPLALAFCRECCLTQITETVPPEVMFREYAYFSSVSAAMVEHAKRLATQLMSSRALGPESLVVEIASNDGYLLQHYVARGIPVLGFDPAANVAEAATAKGIRTIVEFFGSTVAADLRQSGTLADVIHANNVLAHVPDLEDFVAGLAMILKPGGVLVIETPYVRDLVDRMEFDTIYHEHVFYYSVSALVRIFERHGLTVSDVERIPIHGGSLRVFVTRESAGRFGASVSRLLAEETSLGMCDVSYFDGLAQHVEALGRQLREVLGALKARGSSVAAYGAAAKGTVLLNTFGIGRETIDFVADRSPYKHGRFMPGVRIPIRPAEDLVALRPDACLVLAWNFADEILAQQAAYRAAGGEFVIPGPTVTTA